MKRGLAGIVVGFLWVIVRWMQWFDGGEYENDTP
jgi:hypothetical protein